MARAKTTPAVLVPEPVEAPVVETAPEPAQPPRYFVVNPHGAVHEVEAGDFHELTRRTNWRAATPEEVSELARRGGNQSAENPIGGRA